jgi:hypothetical protein
MFTIVKRETLHVGCRSTQVACTLAAQFYQLNLENGSWNREPDCVICTELDPLCTILAFLHIRIHDLEKHVKQDPKVKICRG